MQTQVQTLKGFRDFLPKEKRIREFVKHSIVKTFEEFGFEPIETPTLEYASLLLGKYGDEADKLVYSFKDKGDREIALRYDQTVPTTRVLAQYQNELPKFFRRYQIQSVFRADKPQKGRYREFTQCDCDIFGTSSPVADAELLAVYAQVYKNLGITSLKILINDRETLFNNFKEFTTESLSVFSILQSIDKLDKLPKEVVLKELQDKGLSADNAQAVLDRMANAEMSESLKTIIDNAVALGADRNTFVFTPNLVRGLDYYTGMIFEGKIEASAGGSVGGGGRYDNLVYDLSGLKTAAAGFGIGFDRTVEAMEELGLIPDTIVEGTKVLVSLFGNEDLKNKSLNLAKILRQNGIKTEVYPELEKLGKQFKLADQKKIPFVVVIGENEDKENKILLKEMLSGEQKLMSLVELLTVLKIS